MGGGCVKNRKKSSKNVEDIVSYALEMSINGVTCVCSPLQVTKYI